VSLSGTFGGSGTFSGSEPFSVKVDNLTILKPASLDAPNWSVAFSGAEITGDLQLFRSRCGRTTKYSVSRPTTKPTCSDDASAPVVCEGCATVATGQATTGDCDENGDRTVTFALAFNPPIPQGAQAQVSWSYGGPDAQGATGATDSLDTTNGPVGQHARTATMPPHPPSGSPNACSYFASAVVTIVESGVLCPALTVDFCVTVDSCLPCPGDPAHRVPPVFLRVGTPTVWCAPPLPGQAAQFTASVNFPSGVNAPAPAGFDWTIVTPAGANFLQSTTSNSVDTSSGWSLNGQGPSGPVDLSQSGDYSVGVTAKFALDAGLPANPDGTSACNLTGAASFQLEACGGSARCPSITALNVAPACADPDRNISANITFSATASDPGGVGDGFEWDFGDPGSGGNNHRTTATPSATHSYRLPGNYTVTVTARAKACDGGGPTTATTLVTVPFCPCPDGQRRDRDGHCVQQGENLGCQVLRELAAALAALALLILGLSFCIATPADAWIFWTISGVLAGLAAILFFWWLLSPCPKPCGWGLLFFGQILFGVGWGAVYFFFCCGWIGWVGLGALVVGGGLLAGWIAECRVGPCRVFRELAWVLTVVVLPTLAIILVYPPAIACFAAEVWGRVIAAALSIIAAAIVSAALACAASGDN
jgi:hypothetical protein